MTQYNEDRVKECWKGAYNEFYRYNKKYIEADTADDRDFYDEKQIRAAIEMNAIIQTYCIMTDKIYEYVRDEWSKEAENESTKQ